MQFWDCECNKLKKRKCDKIPKYPCKSVIKSSKNFTKM